MNRFFPILLLAFSLSLHANQSIDANKTQELLAGLYNEASAEIDMEQVRGVALDFKKQVPTVFILIDQADKIQKRFYDCHYHGQDLDCHFNYELFKDIADSSREGFSVEHFKMGVELSFHRFKRTLSNRSLGADAIKKIETWFHYLYDETIHENGPGYWTRFVYVQDGEQKEVSSFCHAHSKEERLICHYRLKAVGRPDFFGKENND